MLVNTGYPGHDLHRLSLDSGYRLPSVLQLDLTVQK
jgi:hypothetical protein